MLTGFYFCNRATLLMCKTEIRALRSYCKIPPWRPGQHLGRSTNGPIRRMCLINSKNNSKKAKGQANLVKEWSKGTVHRKLMRHKSKLPLTKCSPHRQAFSAPPDRSRRLGSHIFPAFFSQLLVSRALDKISLVSQLGRFKKPWTRQNTVVKRVC